MTYNSIYTIAASEHGQKEFTLYEACMALIEIAKKGELKDATHIRCNGRCVAFFSEYTTKVETMWQAGPDESEVIGDGWGYKFS